jgi:uncharacterized protein (TIGR00288 family)
MDKLQDSLDRRSVRPDVDETHQAALLIDFDNVTMGIRSNLGQELRNLLNSEVIRGKVAVQRAYADWRRYPQYIVPLSEASIDLIFAPAYGSSKKNATDIRLAIDALELVFIRPEIRTIILMSGDSDFSSLVLKLKEYGKYIIGVGIQESSSDLLVQNCDEYYSYSALTGLSKTGDQQLESHDPWVLVQKAAEKMVERGDTMRSDRLKQVMIEIDPTFNEKEQGFNKFNRFVVEAASRGLLSIQKMENGQYGIALAAKGAKAAPEGRPEKKEVRARKGAERRTRESRPAKAAAEETQTSRARPKLTMKSALGLLRQALGALLEGDAESVRDSDVKRKLLELDPSFDEGEIGFSKFSKFLQAAEEQGAITLTRGPNGNFHVSLSKQPPKRSRKAARPAPEPEQPLQQEEGTMRRLARFLFGDREDELEPEEKKPAEWPKPKAEKAEPAERAPRPEGAAPRDRKGDREPRSRGKAAPARTQKGQRPVGRAPRGEAAARGERGRRGEQRAGTGRRRGERRPREERRKPAEREATERAAGPAGRERKPEAADRVPDAAEVSPDAVELVPETIERAPTAGESTPAAATPSAEIESVKELLGADAPAAEAPPSAAPEVVPADQPAKPEKAAAETGDSAVAPAPLPGAPRGTIRGRWGARGRYRPAAAPPPIFDGQKVARSDEAAAERPAISDADQEEVREAPADPGPNAALIARLTAYAGVGRRTAESLVHAFGADVFRVLDQEPERVRQILPDHRAERVLEARQEELNSGGE